MVRRRFADYEHLFRVLGLFAASALVFLVARGLFVPHDFGLYGHYRAGALEDNRARPVSFAGRTTCHTCHSDVVDAQKGGKHGSVGCEACHGPQARHAQAEDQAAAKPARPDAQVCLVCHLANAAKPRAFPQIVLKDHAEPGSCLTCHKAHRPAEPPEEPTTTASGEKP